MANVAPAAPGVMRVAFNQTYGNAVNVMNRLFFTFSGTLDQTTAGIIAAHFETVWVGSVAPLVSTTYSLDSITVTDLGSTSGTQVDHPAANLGTLAAADFLPATTCMCITGLISRRYRGGKPRWYQTGHHQSGLQDNQHFTSTSINSWEAAINVLAEPNTVPPTNGGVVQNNINLSLVEGYSWTEYTTSSGKINYRKDPIYRAVPVHDIINAWVPLARVSSQRKRGVN